MELKDNDLPEFIPVMRRPLLVGALVLCCGAAFSWNIPFDSRFIWLFLFIGLLLWLFSLYFSKFQMIAFLILLFFVGAGLVSYALPHWEEPLVFEQDTKIVGLVESSHIHENGKTLLINDIKLNDLEADGKIKVYLNHCYRELQPGDQITFTAKLNKFQKAAYPFAYDAYKEEMIKGIRFQAFLENDAQIQFIGHEKASFFVLIAQAMRDVFCRYLKPDNAGIVCALLTGDRGLMSEDLYQVFYRLGGIHVFSVSGMHVGLLGGLCLFFLTKIKKYRTISLFLTSALIVCYALLTGAVTSVLRAGFMWMLLLLAGLLNKHYDGLTALSFACILTLFLKPLDLFSNAFLLSYGAAFSIILLYPLFSPIINELPPVIRYLAGIFALSCIVAFGTFPATIRVTGTFIPLAAVYNLLLIPLAAFDMVSGLLMLLVSWIPFLAQYLANIINPINDWALNLLEIMARNALHWHCAGISIPFILLYCFIIYSMSPNVFYTGRRYKLTAVLTLFLGILLIGSNCLAPLYYGDNKAVVLDDSKAMSVIYRDEKGTHALIQPYNSNFSDYVLRAYNGELDSLTFAAKESPPGNVLKGLEMLDIKVLYMPSKWRGGDLEERARQQGITVLDLELNPSIHIEQADGKEGSTLRYVISDKISYYAAVSKDSYFLLPTDEREIVLFNPNTTLTESYLKALRAKKIITKKDLKLKNDHCINIRQTGCVRIG